MRYRTGIMRRMVSGGEPSPEDDLRDVELVPESWEEETELKHLPGQHDQISHGSWAQGSAEEPVSRTPITTVEQRRELLAQKDLYVEGNFQDGLMGYALNPSSFEDVVQFWKGGNVAPKRVPVLYHPKTHTLVFPDEPTGHHREVYLGLFNVPFVYPSVPSEGVREAQTYAEGFSDSSVHLYLNLDKEYNIVRVDADITFAGEGFGGYGMGEDEKTKERAYKKIYESFDKLKEIGISPETSATISDYTLSGNELSTTLKHLPGRHEQESHGNWAKGSSTSLQEKYTSKRMSLIEIVGKLEPEVVVRVASNQIPEGFGTYYNYEGESDFWSPPKDILFDVVAQFKNPILTEMSENLIEPESLVEDARAAMQELGGGGEDGLDNALAQGFRVVTVRRSTNIGGWTRRDDELYIVKTEPSKWLEVRESQGTSPKIESSQGQIPENIKSMRLRDIDRENGQMNRYISGEQDIDDPLALKVDSILAGDSKDKIATNLSKAARISYDDANSLIKGWAQTSNDGDGLALGVQQAVSEEFGIPMQDWQKEHMARVQSSREEHFPGMIYETDAYPFELGYHKVLSAETLLDKEWSEFGKEKTKTMLRVMYDQTQTELEAAGIEYVTVFRGVGSSIPETFEDSPWKSMDNLSMNPISSWSTSPLVASGFGNTVLAMRVPRERILSTPQTGFGCTNEFEVVLLGDPKGQDTAIIFPEYLTQSYPHGSPVKVYDPDDNIIKVVDDGEVIYVEDMTNEEKMEYGVWIEGMGWTVT